MMRLVFSLTALLALGSVLETLDAAAIKVRTRANWGENPDKTVKDALSFGDVDANGDGKVSAQEWSEARKQFERGLTETKAAAISGLDASQSGKLSVYEAQAGKGRWVSLWDRAIELCIAKLDKDDSGDLDDKEAEPLVARLKAVVTRHNLRIPHEKSHATHDEVVSAFQEVIDGKRTIFSMCDVNNDGELAQIEIGYAIDILEAISG